MTLCVPNSAVRLLRGDLVALLVMAGPLTVPEARRRLGVAKPARFAAAVVSALREGLVERVDVGPVAVLRRPGDARPLPAQPSPRGWRGLVAAWQGAGTGAAAGGRP